ncbi:MAG: dipeptide ABC transporter ATP-binding protein [Alphaproteobacteria bacterium]|nr:dipeptide ABC transporter ATP-binding protein [Alphaproteobacteria bacterium]
MTPAATAPAVIEARDLTRHFVVSRGIFRGTATVRAVDGVSFKLPAGRTLAVVGESGCGKSTLARIVALLDAPTGGALIVDGADATTGGKAVGPQLRRSVQMVFQNPYGSLNPRKTVGAILEEPLIINTPLDAGARAEAARAMLAKVGLRPEHHARYPHMFSGGQRQRIAIARALMLNPRVVVADEPVSALDVSIQAQVLNLMLDLQEEFRLAYLFISHDLSVVRHIADEVMVMYLGRPVEHGPKRAVFERPRHPYTRALLASTPSTDPARRGRRQALAGELPSPLDPPSGCAFHKRCPHMTELCARERPAPRVLDGTAVACHHAEAVAADAA